MCLSYFLFSTLRIFFQTIWKIVLQEMNSFFLQAYTSLYFLHFFYQWFHLILCLKFYFNFTLRLYFLSFKSLEILTIHTILLESVSCNYFTANICKSLWKKSLIGILQVVQYSDLQIFYSKWGHQTFSLTLQMGLESWTKTVRSFEVHLILSPRMVQAS